MKLNALASFCLAIRKHARATEAHRLAKRDMVTNARRIASRNVMAHPDQTLFEEITARRLHDMKMWARLARESASILNAQATRGRKVYAVHPVPSVTL